MSRILKGITFFVQQTGRASCGVSIEQCAQWCKVEYHQFFLTMLYTKRLLQNDNKTLFDKNNRINE